MADAPPVTKLVDKIEVPFSTLEAYLENSFGEHLACGRTPLHTACRAGNTSAMETLLAAVAKTNVEEQLRVELDPWKFAKD